MAEQSTFGLAPRGTVTPADIQALNTRLRQQHGLSAEAAEDMIRADLLPNLYQDRQLATPHTRKQLRQMPLREAAPQYKRGQDPQPAIPQRRKQGLTFGYREPTPQTEYGIQPAPAQPEYIRYLNKLSDILADPRNSWLGMGAGGVMLKGGQGWKVLKRYMESPGASLESLRKVLMGRGLPGSQAHAVAEKAQLGKNITSLGEDGAPLLEPLDFTFLPPQHTYNEALQQIPSKQRSGPGKKGAPDRWGAAEPVLNTRKPIDPLPGAGGVQMGGYHTLPWDKFMEKETSRFGKLIDDIELGYRPKEYPLQQLSDKEYEWAFPVGRRALIPLPPRSPAEEQMARLNAIARQEMNRPRSPSRGSNP